MVVQGVDSGSRGRGLGTTPTELHTCMKSQVYKILKSAIRYPENIYYGILKVNRLAFQQNILNLPLRNEEIQHLHSQGKTSPSALDASKVWYKLSQQSEGLTSEVNGKVRVM